MKTKSESGGTCTATALVAVLTISAVGCARHGVFHGTDQNSRNYNENESFNMHIL
ncbi:hypothetical protein KM620_gp038 [Hyposidra talaca nucleopolyhedrovirus]|uniref:Lipoprotein n=1 Tax=Hyposidra talaca nucleopolyhedrovirus TaxID=1070315 RepID=A0A2Z4HHZ6_9ABAC|nr:hypothetical protein KM620_gp038 [Hyposidra talaca nucleopolyhedrovirus]AWW14398.1 hypothetical protein HytaNPV_gp038 [Hyposidra talaca nucleopolyhedrovirus]